MNRPRYKLGRDVVVGDALHNGRHPHYVARLTRYAPATGAPGRLAYDAADVAMVVFDDYPTRLAAR